MYIGCQSAKKAILIITYPQLIGNKNKICHQNSCRHLSMEGLFEKKPLMHSLSINRLVDGIFVVDLTYLH